MTCAEDDDPILCCIVGPTIRNGKAVGLSLLCVTADV